MKLNEFMAMEPMPAQSGEITIYPGDTVKNAIPVGERNSSLSLSG